MIGEGDLLPDVALVDHEGRPWRLSDHRGRPLVLILNRHLACLPCQEHIIAVRNHQAELGDALVVVVAFTRDRSRLAEYRLYLGLGTPVVADTERTLYRMLGAGRGSLRRVWSWGTLAMYARLLRQGRRLRLPREDIRQLGADAVVDRAGRLYRVWLPSGPDQRPPASEIVAAVRRLGRG
ncbi:MAG: redoxin domain-containing protein [Ilumatobacteraceae bacterium]